VVDVVAALTAQPIREFPACGGGADPVAASVSPAKFVMLQADTAACTEVSSKSSQKISKLQKMY
jgi:hypothetical protein